MIKLSTYKEDTKIIELLKKGKAPKDVVKLLKLSNPQRVSMAKKRMFLIKKGLVLVQEIAV